MDKKTSWTIALLLAAIVPFATGCNECDAVKDLRPHAEGIQDRLAEIAPNGVANAKRPLTQDDCNYMKAQIAILANPDKLKDMHDHFCDGSQRENQRNPYCQNAMGITNSIHGTQDGSQAFPVPFVCHQEEGNIAVAQTETFAPDWPQLPTAFR